VRKSQNYVNKLIRDAKQLYYHKLGESLSDPHTGQKIFGMLSNDYEIRKNSRIYHP